MDNKTAWNKYSAEDLAALEALCGEYKAFLDGGKTERECVAQAVRMVEAAGYEPLDTALCNRRKKGPGDKLYAVCMGKTLALFHLGTEPLENGMNILGAHIDSPRVDVKQNPLYENEGLGYLDTHYYGGIKKYQWVAQPMALHGTVVRTDGTQVNVSIGEDPAAADSVGINIKRYKYIHICIGCAIMGVGGYYMGLNMSGSFSSGCWINGYGWIAVALVIFANWNPAMAILGTFVFGFFNTLRVSGGGLAAAFPGALGWLAGIPSQLYQALPFIITALVLVGDFLKESGYEKSCLYDPAFTTGYRKGEPCGSN